MTLTNFQRVVAAMTLSGVGMGLVGIFIPIYLLQLHYTLPSVISWLLVLHLSLLVGSFAVIFVANHIGLVRCWYLRTVLTAVLFSGLLLLPAHAVLFYALAILAGFESAFFWIPNNIFTVRTTDHSTMGSSLAFMSNVGTAAGVLVPGIAALLIVFVGYYALFGVAFAFILISLVPVISLKQTETNFKFSWAAMWKIIQTNKRFIVPEVIDNFGEDAQVVWTLFIFVTALTVLGIGALGVIVSIVGIAVTYTAGALVDRWSKKLVLRFGAVLTTLLWIASYVVAITTPTPFALFIVTALRGLTLGIFLSAYSAIVFNRARSDDAQFLVLREIPTILGRTILFLLALFLASIGHLELTFLVVAGVSFYFWFNNVDALLEQQSRRPT